MKTEPLIPRRGSVHKVLSQHLEEASFQWFLRNVAVGEPHYSLKDLEDLDGRVEAHLDGLRLADDHGWAATLEEVSWDEPGHVFAVVATAVSRSDLESVERALEAAQAPELVSAFVSALGWTGLEVSGSLITRLSTAESCLARSIAIGGAAVSRHDLEGLLATAIEGEDAAPRNRALKAAGELGRIDLVSHCARYYEAESVDTRFRAAYSGALLGNGDEASRTLYHISLEAGPFRERAADMVARVMHRDRVLAWHANLASDAGTVRLACAIARTLGDPSLVPWLLDTMAIEEHSRAAGEAFSWITGVDLAYQDLDQDAPDDFVSGPNDDPADANVAMDADEELPWPDTGLLRKWWEKEGMRFVPGNRYIGGLLLSPQTCGTVLRDGMQRQRASVALELALVQPGRVLFETRARGDFQKNSLS